MSNMFLDYEPGIHYTQFQMQAGLTGLIQFEYTILLNSLSNMIVW